MTKIGINGKIFKLTVKCPFSLKQLLPIVPQVIHDKLSEQRLVLITCWYKIRWDTAGGWDTRAETLVTCICGPGATNDPLVLDQGG